MSIKIIPAVPAKRMCECDGCYRVAEAKDGSVLPFGWNRIAARDKTVPVQRPIYGDCGGWPTAADETSLHDKEYCDDCCEMIVEYLRNTKRSKTHEA